jgi:hypothetical protein
MFVNEFSVNSYFGLELSFYSNTYSTKKSLEFEILESLH